MQVDMNGLWLAQMNQVMNVVSTQQKTIAQNIANCNTPGYARQQINFQDALVNAMSEENPTMSAAEISAERDPLSPARQDGNNVSVEKEMVALSQNTQLFSAVSKLVGKNLQMMRYVITGGRS